MYDELAVMHAVQHENIVEYIEMFNRPDGYYVILERINGGELFDRIIELQTYTETEASTTIRQAFAALNHMHQIGYVHRDLKPENLLLSSRDANASIKLADFGFTSKMRENGLRSVVGTPPYMAPELVKLRSKDKKIPSYGLEVDAWSIGIILYILLSGIHPFQIDDEDEMLDNIEVGEWEWMGDNWDQVSDDAKDLIRRLMDPNPRSRLTIEEALNHPWIVQNNRNDSNLASTQEQIRKFQARKRFKVAIQAVVATNRLRKALENLKEGNDDYDPEDLNDEVNINDQEDD